MSAISLKQRGFSLIELMIVVGLIAILAGISYPTYIGSVMEANRDAAKAGLMLLSTEMGRAKIASSTNNYANLIEGEGTPIPTLFPAQLPLDSGTKTYDITIELEASDAQFLLVATPIEGTMMEGDGVLTLSSTGAKTWNDVSGWD